MVLQFDTLRFGDITLEEEEIDYEENSQNSVGNGHVNLPLKLNIFYIKYLLWGS